MPMWECVAFESEIKDPRDRLYTEYDGLRLFLKPNMEAADQIAVFCRLNSDSEQVRLKINRFLSAMAWKDGIGYRALGSGGAGALLDQQDNPHFCFGARREFAYCTISRYDFEHLQNPPEPKQKLSLALYREGLATNDPFYRFLSFYKIINILHSTGPAQELWINTNLGRITDSVARARAQQLSTTRTDIGHYLCLEGRNAIAHSFNQPIRDPDIPNDLETVHQDIRLMRALAELFIEQEFNIPSMRTIWREHLYELTGFKAILGDIVAQLKTNASIPIEGFPALPALSLRLKEKPQFPCFENLNFAVTDCRNGKVELLARSDAVGVCLTLDFPHEKLVFGTDSFGIERDHPSYHPAVEICLYEFLIAFLKNGVLEILTTENGERLGFKDPHLPVNINLPATIRELEGRIAELRT